MNESIDAQYQSITIDLSRPFRKKADFQLLQDILCDFQEKRILPIGNISDAVRKCLMHLFGKFLLVTLVREEPLSGNDLADEISIVATPFPAGEFDSAVFVNTIYTVIIANSCTFAWLELGYIVW